MSQLSPEQFARLVRLNAELKRVLELQAPQARDRATGTFKSGTTISPRKLRAAWSTTGMGRRGIAVKPQFRAALAAALRKTQP